MKIKEGFRLRSLGREFIVTAESTAHVNFNKMISLNSSAAYLWQSVEGKDFSVEDIKNLLCERYDVDEAVALKDAEALVNSWKEAGVIE